jgi:hypothetical protein
MSEDSLLVPHDVLNNKQPSVRVSSRGGMNA